MLHLLESGITKILAKPTNKKEKDKEKEKETNIDQKIAPLEALIDQEGWKASLLKGMYVVQLLAVIQMIWSKGNLLTYVAKKLMNLVVLVEQGINMNWVKVVFNNLYCRL